MTTETGTAASESAEGINIRDSRPGRTGHRSTSETRHRPPRGDEFTGNQPREQEENRLF